MSLPGTRSPAGRAARAAGWTLTALAAGALAGSAAGDVEAPARLVRVIGLLGTAAMAIAAPHVLFPDPHVRLAQLANLAPGALLRRQLGRWAPVPLALAVPAAVAGWGDLGLVAEGAATALAVGLVAFARASGLGPRSRAWERGEAGGWYRTLNAWAPPVRFLVPDPLVPGVLLTGEVFLAGAAVAVAGQAGGPAWGLGAAALVALAAGASMRARLRTFDRAYWLSNGVWADAFRQVEVGEGREPVRLEAVYWAPPALRPTVWAGLVSLDRRVPLGRVAVVLLGLAVLVHLAGVGPGAEAAALTLYGVVVNGTVALSASDDVVPPSLAARLGGASRWAAARFLMNVRWLPPLAAALLLLVWLVDLGWAEAALWLGLDATAAALAALAVTLADRVRLRRALA